VHHGEPEIAGHLRRCPVAPGDRLEGHIDGIGDVTVTYEG
jgi:hypothetical protein